MSTRLKQYAYVPIAALALWAVLLAASPAAANAQESPSPSKDPRPTEGAVAGAERVVVAPGDSLWSISAQWLGPDATTRQITDGVERIYVLNRDRIGTDPNLLFAGQRLVLPPAERRTPERASAVSKREVGKTDGKADQNVRQAAARTEPAPLPELAQAAPVPAVGSLTSTDAHSPSLAESAVSEPRSAFSSVVAAVGGAFPRGEDSERKLLGGALIGISAVLAIILALHVARVALGPYYAERRAQKHWIRETRSRTKYASLPAFDAREAHGAAYAATEDHPLDGGPQKVAKLALARGLRPRASSRHSAKGGASTDALRDPTTSRGGAESIRRARALEARRQSRRRAKIGGLRSSQARRTPPNRAQRARAIRRKEIDVDTGPKGAEANRELEIGELLRRSIASLPLQPGTCERYALSEVKPLAEAALATMTALERRRRLTDKEHRQAGALQRMLAALKEADGSNRTD